MSPEFLALGFVLFWNLRMQGQKRLDIMQEDFCDSEFDACTGQEDLRVSTLFDSKAMHNQNLYFLTQDVHYPGIFYASDKSRNGNCIKRFNLAAGNSSEKRIHLHFALSQP